MGREDPRWNPLSPEEFTDKELVAMMCAVPPRRFLSFLKYFFMAGSNHLSVAQVWAIRDAEPVYVMSGRIRAQES